MKTVFLCLACLVLALQGFGQTTPKKPAVPAPVQAAFAKAYPAAENPRWEKDKRDYEVAFSLNHTRYELKYDARGSLLEKEEVLDPKDLPAPVRAILDKDFAGYAVGEAERVEKGGIRTYEVQVSQGRKKRELVFDEAGKLLENESE